MKTKLIAAALALGVSGQAAAQDPVANVGQAVGNLVPNLTNTVDSLLALEVTNTTLALNQTVTDLHMDLSAGTPLATDSSLNDTLMVLATPQTDMIDDILAGDKGLDGFVSDLQKLATFDPALLFILSEDLLANPTGTVLDPEIGGTLLLSLLPLEALNGGLPSGGDSPLGGLLDPGLLLGLLGGAGGDSPLGGLDALTGLLGGGTGGLPLDALPLSTLLGLLSLEGAGSGGLSADALPLPLDALDTGTLTALLDGASLPGLQ
ncbi:hypothetical protein PC39_07089 [Salinisphaera sp. PC39]|uniref:hypothetical protein n=1 Tax=Salinisphaera sp. PC39 TaxID=1304156 RepID=UPI00333F5E7E